MKTGTLMDEEDKLNTEYVIKSIAEMQGIPLEVAERFLKAADRFRSREEKKDESK